MFEKIAVEDSFSSPPCKLREKCPNNLIRIFPHSDWIRRDTEYLFVFHPNAKKYGPEKIPYLDTSRSGKSTRRYTLQWMLPWLFINIISLSGKVQFLGFVFSPSKILIILSIPLLLCIVKNFDKIIYHLPFTCSNQQQKH